MQTRGNLYVPSAFNRLGELTETEQIRWAANTATMEELGASPRRRRHMDRSQRPGREAHDLSQVLTGAVFDVVVDVFQRMLVERGLLSRRLHYLAKSLVEEVADLEDVRDLFAGAYRGHHDEFKRVLEDARDWAGYGLAASCRPAAGDLNFAEVGRELVEVDREMSGGRFGDIVGVNFARRGILLAGDAARTRSRPPTADGPGCRRCGMGGGAWLFVRNDR